MGIYNALYTGSSGLSAFGETVRVIGDNIANVNSLGFKSQNVIFSDVLSQTVSVTRSNIANQVGNGVRIGQITRDRAQGSIQNTTNATDMAINGNGMFALKDPASNQTLYSRAGAFFLDKNSSLIDGQGNVVQGWKTTEQGAATGNITGITFGGLSSQAQATTTIDAGITLDSNAVAYNAGVAFDPANSSTFHYKAEATIFDSLGQQHAVSLYYIKNGNNDWQWQVGVDGGDVAGGIAGEQVILGNPGTNFNSTNPTLTTAASGTTEAAMVVGGGVGVLAGTTAVYTIDPINAAAGDAALRDGTEISGNTSFSNNVFINGTLVTAGQTLSAALGNSAVITSSAIPAGTTVKTGNVLSTPGTNQLTFGGNGELVNELGAGINFPWNSAAVATVNFNFGNATGFDQQSIKGDGLNGTVQMAGNFATRQITRDGFSSGFLDKLETDSSGRIFGVFTNGQRRSLYQVALAKFPNDSVLNHVGNNLQEASIGSGSPVFEKPGNGGMGTITPYGLEQSNVDLAGEFVKLIIVQRGYEANSKTISTTDQMLSSLMQLKR